MWILQSNKVTGTRNASDRTCVRKKDQSASKLLCSLDLCQGKELQMQEKYRCKGKKLYFAFVDLEKKAFERSLGGL